MAGVPIFMQSESVTLIRTQNGYALAAEPGAPIVQAVTFSTLPDAIYYLEVNFPRPVTP